ncbi:MAG: acetate--CoA ligase family protein, partial [Pseudomonadota bacterium]
MLLKNKRWPRGRRAAATTISGGNGALLVDLGATLGIEWPEYTQQTQTRLEDWLPKLGTSNNPTDLSSAAIGRENVFRRCIEIIAEDENVDAVIPIFTMAAMSDLEQGMQACRNAVKPVALLWAGGCSTDASMTARTLIEQGVPVYRNTLTCLKAVRAAMGYGEFLHARATRTPARPQNMDPDAARGVIKRCTGAMTERESKQLLAAYGFPIMQEALAATSQDAVRIASAMAAPVALKIESPNIAHKTEADAIRLNVVGDQAVERAYEEVLANAKRHAPSATINGVLVQPMAPAGLEVMLGLVHDLNFGPVVVVGLGGIHVEVLHDVAYRAAPVSQVDAGAMLDELRSAALLHGVRGAAPRDIDALVDLIVRLSWLGHDLQNAIEELDINPLIVLERGRGARVVDALVVARRGTQAEENAK